MPPMNVRNVNAIISNLHNTNEDFVVGAKRLALQYGAIMKGRIQQKLPAGASADHPYSVGFRRQQVRTRFTPSGLVFESGFFAEDFEHEPSGRGVFYAPFTELGTVDRDAQPSIKPAADEVIPEYNQALVDLLRRTTRRYSA